MSQPAVALTPRKLPIQSRSAATLEALHLATIQVLTDEGLKRCTTTRVAERAGMSVGSLYQYYPNRDSLLAAILERHLADVGNHMERACLEAHNMPVAAMARAVVTAFLTAKLSDPATSRALYAVAAERGGANLSKLLSTRIVAVMSGMLRTAPDARFEDPAAVGAISFSALAGPVRGLLEGTVPEGLTDQLQAHLVPLLTGYFQARGSRDLSAMPTL